MPHINDLPHEILSQIFTNLQRKSQPQKCLLTCRKWEAREQIYKEVRPDHVDKVAALFSTITHSLDSLGKFYSNSI
jgi:hypothetical protein